MVGIVTDGALSVCITTEKGRQRLGLSPEEREQYESVVFVLLDVSFSPEHSFLPEIRNPTKVRERGRESDCKLVGGTLHLKTEVQTRWSELKMRCRVYRSTAVFADGFVLWINGRRQKPLFICCFLYHSSSKPEGKQMERMSQAMEKVRMLVGIEVEDDQQHVDEESSFAFMDDFSRSCTLSTKQRLYGFAICLVAGLTCTLMAFNKITIADKCPMPNIDELLDELYGAMDALTKNRFFWPEAALKAFNDLKQVLLTTPVLRLPNFSKPFVIECDASSNGGVIGTSPSGKKWSHYLLGWDFLIHTDHYTLKFLLELCITTVEQQRLLLKLMLMIYLSCIRMVSTYRPYCVEVANIKSGVQNDSFTSKLIKKLLEDPTSVPNFSLVD
ncbi:hypothetical protein E3N88_29387 [Mikania micrantha]|uniref:Reverse transcriptase/retrotransposon-derived protein RNase H-like domain-containing protein n=1 Tax=Mikania micrantha TaxID=192012 RepID=A0A5N6MLJ5_9ASTR|nr:hypothetical protein E3N88_29387 [Mikania micrantha]